MKQMSEFKIDEILQSLLSLADDIQSLVESIIDIEHDIETLKQQLQAYQEAYAPVPFTITPAGREYLAQNAASTPTSTPTSDPETVPYSADELLEPTTIEEAVKSGKYLILDVETTGLKSSDHRPEICQIAIIDQDGNALMYTTVKPKGNIQESASRVHGITNERVKDAPTLPELLPRLISILKDQNVLVYNAKFDREQLYLSVEAWGLPRVAWGELARWFCVMEAFAPIYGEWQPRYGSYKWQKLSTAATHYGLTAYPAHDALGDTQATLSVVKEMFKEGNQKANKRSYVVNQQGVQKSEEA